MLTQARAQALYEARKPFCSLPYAFAQKGSIEPVLYENGMTEEEDAYVRKLWNTMPGNTCYMDAFNIIRLGIL